MPLQATSSPHELDKQGRTDLHWHCFYGNTSSVRACLKNGYDPNVQDSSGYTPLMLLVEMHDNRTYRQRKRMFRYLIAAGASVELSDTIGADLKDLLLGRRFPSPIEADGMDTALPRESEGPS